MCEGELFHRKRAITKKACLWDPEDEILSATDRSTFLLSLVSLDGQIHFKADVLEGIQVWSHEGL